MITKRFMCLALNAALCAATVALAGCNQQPTPTATQSAGTSSAPAATGTTAQAPAYTPPSADQLYQMVAPIALFPDKLVAQVLAGSTYPDQITAADNFLVQNAQLQGAALQNVVDPQPWDPSIKGLTVFPKVLDQMAQNIPWTTALGEAYVNDPTDVMNAIQVMRQRASQHGTLRSSAQLRVVDQPVAQAASYAEPNDDGSYPTVYSGPEMVPAPEQTIEIMPAQPDTVYVPDYDPQTAYGEEIPVYPSYRHADRGYSNGELLATGAISFGAGIVIAALLNNHSSHDDRPRYGWNNWGVNWGNENRQVNHDGSRQRPAVVYNRSTYVSNSTTVINRYTTNNRINTTRITSINSNNVNSSNRVNNSPPRNRGAHVPATAPVAMNHRVAPSAPRTPPAMPQPLRTPNFAGALSKGQPARFTHPANGSTPAMPAARTQQTRHMTAVNPTLPARPVPRATVPASIAHRPVPANNSRVTHAPSPPRRVAAPAARQIPHAPPAAVAAAPSRATPRPAQAIGQPRMHQRPVAAVVHVQAPQHPVAAVAPTRPAEHQPVPVRRSAPKPAMTQHIAAARPAAAHGSQPAGKRKHPGKADQNH